MAKSKDEVLRLALLLAEMIKNSPGLLNPNDKEAKDTVDKMANNITEHLPTPAWVSEAGIYYLVVIFLGAVSAMAIIGTIILSAMTLDNTAFKMPDVITALGSAAIGALAGLLAPSPASR